MLYYRDWRPIAFAAGTIAVHHYVVCRLQMAGWHVYVFPPGHPCDMVWVHAAYVVAETLMLAYVTSAIRREALETLAIARFGAKVMKTGVIDLRPGTGGRVAERGAGPAAACDRPGGAAGFAGGNGYDEGFGRGDGDGGM